MHSAQDELKMEIRKVWGKKYEHFKSSLTSICIKEEQRIHDNCKLIMTELDALSQLNMK